jgi:Ser/Thr protein kinase RdoA (MazF antagonist)
MRIQQSVFEEDFIRELIDSRYRLRRVDCCFFCKGQNDTYRVTSDEGIYYFRVYRHGLRKRAEIHSELKILNTLSVCGLEIGEPVLKLNGSYLNHFNAPEGLRYGVLFKGVNGVFDAQPSLEVSSRFGSLLAKMHNCLEGIEVERPKLVLDDVLEEAFKIVDAYGVRKTKHYSIMEEMSGKLQGKLRGRSDEGDWGLCHGDYYLNNIRVNGEDCGVFDFDCCTYAWRSYDIACFLLSLFVNLKSSRRIRPRWNAFITGYKAVRSMSSIDLELIALLGVLRIIWIMTLHSRNAAFDRGISIMDKAYFERGIKLLLNWSSSFGL